MKRTRPGDAPLSSRHAAVLRWFPQVDSNILNRDYGNTQVQPELQEGLYEIAGISIRRSNNLPFLRQPPNPVEGENNNYAGDFTTHCGLIYYRDAAAVVEAIGPQIQTTGSDVHTLYQGDVIVGVGCYGRGTLNPRQLSNWLLLVTD